MEIKPIENKRSLLIKLDGDVDHHSVKKIRAEIDRAFAMSGAVNAVLDFSDVKFMDSSGIGMIMGRYRYISSLGGKIYIIGASESVKRIIGISGLGNITKVCGDWSEILA